MAKNNPLSAERNRYITVVLVLYSQEERSTLFLSLLGWAFIFSLVIFYLLLQSRYIQMFFFI